MSVRSVMVSSKNLKLALALDSRVGSKVKLMLSALIIANDGLVVSLGFIPMACIHALEQRFSDH